MEITGVEQKREKRLKRKEDSLRELWDNIKCTNIWSSHCGTAEMDPTRNHEVVGSIPGLAQWVKDPALP